MKTKVMTILIFLSIGSSLLAQDQDDFEHNQIGLLLAHTHMREGGVSSGNDRLSVPSFTLFYNYRFNEKFSLGLHTDFIAEQFIVESSGDEEIIERKSPIAPAIMFGYKPGEHFTFLIGGGIDSDSEETLTVMRFDIEYGLEIKDGWEFVSALGYDIRFNAYNSLQFGVGLSKAF